MSTSDDSTYTVATAGLSDLSGPVGKNLGFTLATVNLALSENETGGIPPEKFKLSWRVNPSTPLNHQLAQVRFWTAKHRSDVLVPLPDAPVLEGVEGEVPFSSIVTPELANAIRVLRMGGHIINASFKFRPILQISDRSSLEGAAMETITHYAQNDVVFLFPAKGKQRPLRRLWSKSLVLAKSSPYFKTLFGSDGFTETAKKLEAPKFEFDAFEQGETSNQAQKSPSASTSDAITDSKKGGGGGEKSEALTKKGGTSTTGHQEEEDDAMNQDSDLENDYYPSPAPSPSIHRIVVRHTAYKTLFSYLYYLETGNVYFSPLSSLLPRSHTPPPFKPSSPPSCSPKSMYRLASFYEHQTLRELAYKSIAAQLDCRNALMELFSDLSADYEEIKSLCVVAVLDNWSYVKDSKQMKDLETDLRDGVLEERKVGLVFELFTKLKPATS
ncbi:BTB/POZ domain-containing protein [Sporobolomyces salmoneus]|uniref:BTB/POZ domain-containing protein n=1 Tax=Sporobolomyces salmoneus TaxID=183962 RepID=UPI00317F12FA